MNDLMFFYLKKKHVVWLDAGTRECILWYQCFNQPNTIETVLYLFSDRVDAFVWMID